MAFSFVVMRAVVCSNPFCRASLPFFFCPLFQPFYLGPSFLRADGVVGRIPGCGWPGCLTAGPVAHTQRPWPFPPPGPSSPRRTFTFHFLVDSCFSLLLHFVALLCADIALGLWAFYLRVPSLAAAIVPTAFAFCCLFPRVWQLPVCIVAPLQCHCRTPSSIVFPQLHNFFLFILMYSLFLWLLVFFVWCVLLVGAPRVGTAPLVFSPLPLVSPLFVVLSCGAPVEQRRWVGLSLSMWRLPPRTRFSPGHRM